MRKTQVKVNEPFILQIPMMSKHQKTERKRIAGIAETYITKIHHVVIESCIGREVLVEIIFKTQPRVPRVIVG